MATFEYYLATTTTTTITTPSSSTNGNFPFDSKASSMKSERRWKEKSTTTTDDGSLPKWITDYIAWHNEVRSKWPGRTLFDDPEAPNVLIRVCLGLCGGLNDRIGQLPWDLYLANQTRRVLFLQWSRPKPIEDFFLPNAFNWSIPPDVPGFKNMHQVRALPELFANMSSSDAQPGEEFWKRDLNAALHRARDGEFSNVKILRHRLLGHLNEDVLERRLKALGETDMIHATSSFGNVFWAFFKPSLGVQAEYDLTRKQLHLEPFQYSVVHCRVRHPKATAHGKVVHGKNENYPADKTGLPWFGDTRDFAISIGTHALRCARTVQSDPNEPIYFMADSNDLVKYMVEEVSSDAFWNGNATIRNNPVEQGARAAVKSVPSLVARNVTLENAHIDRQKGRDPPAYYATFVDLLLASHARCVTYGIGFYAVLASKISQTPCILNYQEEVWGGKEGGKGAPVCSEESYQHLQ